ncbi:MAG: MobF family relaxase [Acidimicrobiales bacterium]
MPGCAVSEPVGGAGVLSLGKLAPGQQQYYLDTVARGAEEYYTGAKEAPGVWVGAGAGRLGLSGEVDAEVLGRVLEHVDPSGVYRLTASRSVPVVAGFDVTFCAPKSVSLLFALGPPEVSNEVRNAADAAMAASAGVLEQVACRVRRGRGGHTVVDGDGFVGAAFRHRTSRAGDPHLHTHVVIANLAHAPSDGRWTALDGRPLYLWLSPVGHLYETHLRWELTRRLGVEWGPVRNGIADVAGISRPVLREFSTRRREIEAHLDEHGQHSARAAQYATYATRRAKDTSIDAEGLVPGWKARAAALGLDAGALAAVLDRGVVVEPPTPGSAEADRLYRWLAGPEGLTARASTFGEREVIKAICNALPAGGSVDRVLDLADGFLRSDHVLAVGLDRGTATIRRADGVLIAARTDEIRWTTPEMLEIEARIVTAALDRQTSGVGVAVPGAVEAGITAGRSLSVEQQAMVRTICGSGDGIDIVEGVAGAGKTYALAAARLAWDASGHRVIGCSLAARAARQLQDDAGIPAATIDRLVGDLDRNNGPGIDSRTVIVVDEAAMVGTRKLARLLGRAEAARAKVVLVGDPCQLPEIDAGGAFRSLQQRLGASRLTQNRRQTQTWERAALAELRAGDTDSAVDAYLRHQRIHQAPTNDKARELLVEHWASARGAGEDGLMVAARLADVDDLNRRARRVLRARGRLGPDQIVLAGRAFAQGDDILALRNDYRLGLLNGTRATIDRIDSDRRHIVAVTNRDEPLVIPFEYATKGHLTHGYATTIHKAQGTTVDRCFVLVDDSADREHGYTAVSRGRYGNDLFVVAADRRTEERHAAEMQPDPLDGLRAAVRRSSAQRFALDELQAGSGSRLERFGRERDLLRARLSQRPPDPARDVRRLTEQRRQIQHYRDGARGGRDVAQQDLDRLGPIGRRTHPARRREIEDRIAGCDAEIVRDDVKLADLDRQLEAHAPVVAARSTWERQHGVELQRLHDLDRTIELIERLDHVATRGLNRGVERSLGVEL